MPFIALLVLSLAACQGKNASPPAAQPSTPGPTKEPTRARVVVHSKAGPAPFDVELALTNEARERGLMYRTEVPAGTGMLFVFPEEAEHVFWMKNTLVSLDMIFLGGDRRIVGIVENAEPRTLTSRDPGARSQYVLEVAAGTAFARGFHVGDLVDFEGVPTL
jgi:uncharacterized membrane protein (UPF0127 family)